MHITIAFSFEVAVVIITPNNIRTPTEIATYIISKSPSPEVFLSHSYIV